MQEYCEQWNHTAGGCVPFGVPPFPTPLPRCGLNGCDTFVLPSTNLSEPLKPKFTWRGFQWVLVVPSAGATFTGGSDALAAHWSTADLTESSTISFGGSGSRLLSGYLKPLLSLHMNCLVLPEYATSSRLLKLAISLASCRQVRVDNGHNAAAE